MIRLINLTLTDATSQQFKFETLEQVKDFCKKEHDFWVTANASIEGKLTLNQAYTKANHFQTIMNTFKSWEEQEPKWDENTFTTQFNQLNQQQFRQLSGDWVWHGQAFIPIWVDLYNKAQTTADSFMLTVLKRNASNIGGSVDHMSGHILGYEFLMQDESDITKRRNSEKKSLSQLRTELNDKNTQLISETENFKEGIESWGNLTREEFERLYKIKQRLAERQRKNQARKFSKELKSWNENIKNLESTYEEVLRLRKPAEYWNKAAKKYGIQGLILSALIIVSVALGLIYFEGFFIAWLQGQELGVKLNTIQGVVIFGTIVAVYAFLIRVLSRLTFSSFHLMRDAEEREQLTYLYLSLSEETNVDEEARSIVLQALFSRSETGLLNQEHGPAMPGVSEAVRLATRTKSQ